MNNYFSHDSNARNSDKLIPLRMRWGAEGYGIYFMILERLREEPGYMSVKDYNMIAFDLRVDTGKVKSIVEDFGLFVFTEDGKYFYSESFKRRMTQKDEKSKKLSEAGKIGNMKRWSKNNASTATQSPPDRKCDENLSQEKKRKVNNLSIVSPLDFGEDDIVPFSCLKKIIFENEQEWYETIAMAEKLKPNEITMWLNNFFTYLECTGEVNKSLKDFKSHFYRWMKIELKGKNENQGKTESTTVYRRGHKSAQSN